MVQFVPSSQIDPIMLERSYYIEPDSESPRAYPLLRQILEETELMAVVKFALRQTTCPGLLRMRAELMVLQGKLWVEGAREADFATTRAVKKVSIQEMKMSAALIKQFTTDFTPEEFDDEYQVQLRGLIRKKLKKDDPLDTDIVFGESGAAVRGAEGSESMINLMEALKRGIANKRPGVKESAAKNPPTTKRTPAKKRNPTQKESTPIKKLSTTRKGA